MIRAHGMPPELMRDLAKIIYATRSSSEKFIRTSSEIYLRCGRNLSALRAKFICIASRNLSASRVEIYSQREK
jgi:hypothetical protein